MSSFYRLKPFYVLSPCPQETESCGSVKRMNPHITYNTIRRHDSETYYPVSLSEHLTKCFVCDKVTKVNYYNVKCITGSCENECFETMKNVFIKQR